MEVFLEHMNQYLIPFLVSMVPLIELRGAIPIAQGMGLPIVPSYIVCIIGNMIPVPFIYLFARRVLVWGADKPVIGSFLLSAWKKVRREVKTDRKSRKGTLCGTFVVCRYSSSRHRGMDRNSGGQYPGHGFQIHSCGCHAGSPPGWCHHDDCKRHRIQPDLRILKSRL